MIYDTTRELILIAAATVYTLIVLIVVVSSFLAPFALIYMIAHSTL